LLHQFHQEVTSWGSTHLYQNPLDGKSYEQNYAYGQKGAGRLLDDAVNSASSSADFQVAIALIQSELANLHSTANDVQREG
jgi:hypothetical protein